MNPTTILQGTLCLEIFGRCAFLGRTTTEWWVTGKQISVVSLTSDVSGQWSGRAFSTQTWLHFCHRYSQAQSRCCWISHRDLEFCLCTDWGMRLLLQANLIPCPLISVCIFQVQLQQHCGRLFYKVPFFLGCIPFSVLAGCSSDI